MTSYTFCVITKVPKPWLGESGNLASASFAHPELGSKYCDSDLYVQNNVYGGDDEDDPHKHDSYPVTWQDADKMLSKKDRNYLSFTTPVFTLGEICILDEPDGREVAGKRRAPRKWYIEYEEFDDIDKAVECAQRVIAEYELNE